MTLNCAQFEFVKSIRKALVKLLSSYGIILTLLASITFVAILQPPGSYDPDGIVRSSKLVAAFMFFATSSFLLACTGLLTVAAGSAMMLRPSFFPQFEDIKVPPQTHPQHGLDPSLHSSQPNHQGEGFDSERPGKMQASQEATLPPNSHEHQPLTPDVTYDELPVMAKIILDNVYRVRRLHLYTGLSLLSCVTAFICAGFAVTKSRSIGLSSLGAAIGLGGVPFFLEIVKVFMGPGGLPFLLEIVEAFMGPTFFRRICCCFVKVESAPNLPIGQPTLHTTVYNTLAQIGQTFQVPCAGHSKNSPV